MNNTYARIYDVIKKIPKGRVATYGQIAQLAGLPGQARQIGYALSALPDNQNVPWHRVVNAQGEISTRALPNYEKVQRQMLEKENIGFDDDGKISLPDFQWTPKSEGKKTLNTVKGIALIVVMSSFFGCASLGLASLKDRMLYSAGHPQSDLGPAEALNQGQLKKYGEINDPELNARLETILKRIQAVLPRQDIDFEVHVLNSDDVNAFTTGGRHLYFHKGLIDYAKNDEELAAVMAHEISHSLCRHVAKGQTIGILSALGAVAGMSLAGDNRLAQQALNMGSAAFPASFSRTSEKEADVLAAAFLKEAGYSLAGGQEFFKRLHQKETEYNNRLNKEVLPAFNLAAANYQTAVNNYNIAANAYNSNPTAENYNLARQYYAQAYAYGSQYQQAEQSVMNFSLNNLGFFRTHPESLSRASLFNKLDENFKGELSFDDLKAYDSTAASVLKTYEEVRALTEAGLMNKEGAQALNVYKKAQKLYTKKQYSRARELLNSAITLKPDYADALRLRGYCYLKEKNFEEARRDLTKALELKPNDEQTKAGLAMVEAGHSQ